MAYWCYMSCYKASLTKDKSQLSDLNRR